MTKLPETLVFSSLCNAYRVHTPSSGALSFSSRQSHGFVLYLNGLCDYHYEGTSFTAHPDNVLFLPQGQPYSIAPQGKSDCLCINFYCEAMMGMPFFIIEPINIGTVQALFEKTVTTWKRRESGYTSICMSGLYAVAAELQQQLDQMETGHPGIIQLKKAYDYIHKYYRKPDLSVTFLASECNMSERSFRSKFKEVFAVSPVKYITNLRMTYARDLLSSQMIPVSEVAVRCGYRDIYYFSRVFKQYYGMAPSYYVQSL